MSNINRKGSSSLERKMDKLFSVCTSVSLPTMESRPGLGNRHQPCVRVCVHVCPCVCLTSFLTHRSHISLKLGFHSQKVMSLKFPNHLLSSHLQNENVVKNGKNHFFETDVLGGLFFVFLFYVLMWLFGLLRKQMCSTISIPPAVLLGLHSYSIYMAGRIKINNVQ